MICCPACRTFPEPRNADGTVWLCDCSSFVLGFAPKEHLRWTFSIFSDSYWWHLHRAGESVRLAQIEPSTNTIVRVSTTPEMTDQFPEAWAVLEATPEGLVEEAMEILSFIEVVES